LEPGDRGIRLEAGGGGEEGRFVRSQESLMLGRVGGGDVGTGSGTGDEECGRRVGRAV
jgi:hypothetical protein